MKVKRRLRRLYRKVREKVKREPIAVWAGATIVLNAVIDRLPIGDDMQVAYGTFANYISAQIARTKVTPVAAPNLPDATPKGQRP